MYSSPWLFAVSRVLRRLLMPRHSPYALLSLNFQSRIALFFSFLKFCYLFNLAFFIGLIVVNNFTHFYTGIYIVSIYPVYCVLAICFFCFFIRFSMNVS